MAPSAVLSERETDFVLEHYRRLSQAFTLQGNRLWARFNYFLTIEAGALGLYFSSHIPSTALPVVGCVLSILWYLIGAQDVWFYQEARERLREFTRREILPGIPRWSETDEETRLGIQPWWRRLLCFKLPRLGVTHFASICPIAFVSVWAVLLGIRLWI